MQDYRREMTHLLPPEIWHHGVFVFLLGGDLARMSRVNWDFHKHVKKWMGDKESKRIRPLLRHDLNKTLLSEPLKLAYSGCLRVWSQCFHEAATEFKHTHKVSLMKDDVAARAVDLLFTTSSNSFKKFTAQSSHDRLWKITTRYLAPHLLSFWDWVMRMGVFSIAHNEATQDEYLIRGMQQFDALTCDREKLGFLHTLKPLTMLGEKQELIGKLCASTVACAMSSHSRPVMEYTEYVLFTVFGKVWPLEMFTRNVGLLRFHDCVNMTPNLLNLVATPNNPQNSIYTLLGSPGASMCQVTSPKIPFIVYHKNVFMTVDVFRNQYVNPGFTLQQRILFTLHGLFVEYLVLNVTTSTLLKVHLCLYNETEPTMRESAEVMCWKYLPVSSMQVHFQCYIPPPIHTRPLKSISDAKIMAHQADVVRKRIAETLTLPRESLHITPYHPIVNNCVWNVLIQV